MRITELNYDPAKPPTGSSYNNDDFEFVELENFSSTTVNLAGVAFTDGITYTFGNVYLLPGQSGVLVHNTAAFVSRYGSSFNIIGDYLSTGQSFSNSGEDVELVDASGNILDHFDYTPCISAYPTAHGKGAALVPVNPGGMTNLNLATNWTVTTYTNGTLPLLLGSTPVYLELDPDGQHIDIWNANTASGPANQSVPIAEINSISFIASGAADTLTVNFSNGDPISVVPLYFDGNSVGTLSVVGVSGAKTVTSNGSTATISAGFGSASIAYLNGGFNFAFTVADTVNVTGGVFSLAESTSGDTPLTIGTASVSAGGTLQLLSSTVAANQNELVLNNLSLAGSSGAWTGKLDLGSNNLILKNGSLATVLNQLAEGFYGGGGIMTSETITSAYTTTLGYEMGGSVIDGVSTASADVVVKYTYFGDANLDGKVDGSDYSRIDSGFVTGATGWMNGDFNYDGVINGSDYTLIDNAFNNQGASLAAEIAPRAGTKSLSRKGSREVDDAPLPNSSVFQTQTPISLALSTDGSIERSMQAKDLLDRLSAAD